MQLSCAFDNLYISRVYANTLLLLSNHAAKVLLFIDIRKYFNIFLMKKLYFLYNLLKINMENFTFFLCKILRKRYRTRDLPLCV